MNKFLFNISRILFVIAIPAFIFSCKSEGEGDDETTEDTTTVISDQPADPNITFKLPSPVELYIFLRQDKVKFNKDILNPIDNVSKYLTTKQKAINFGIYASDLAYCTVYAKNQETFNYFSTAKQIADELGLTEGFDDTMADRIDKNINDPDSLYELSSDAYFTATQFLESQGRANLLPLIIAGGWLESAYIASQSVEKYTEDDPTVLRVAEQQFLLETLVEYFDSIKETNEDIKGILEDMLDLQQSYDKLYDNTDVVITEKQFNEIKAKVTELRNKYTLNESSS